MYDRDLFSPFFKRHLRGRVLCSCFSFSFTAITFLDLRSKEGKIKEEQEKFITKNHGIVLRFELNIIILMYCFSIMSKIGIAHESRRAATLNTIHVVHVFIGTS